MIEIDYSLLSEEALENLIIDIITCEATDYGEYETELQVKKKQLQQKLVSGEAVIVFMADEDRCDIIKAEDFKLNSTLESG